MRITTLLFIIALVGTLALLRMEKELFGDFFAETSAYTSILHLLVFALAGQLIVRGIAGWYRRRKSLRNQQTDTFILGLQNIYVIALFVATLITILGLFGIEARTLFTSLSIVAAAIAIISKDYISEIISGIIISVSSCSF